MPSNHNFVCFDCRQSLRRSKLVAEPPRCPKCGNPCLSVGYKIPLPSKSDAKGWKALEGEQQAAAHRRAESKRANLVRLGHELERQIADIEQRPANPERERLLRVLRQRLA